jgi:glycerol uptake operon antiterminator
MTMYNLEETLIENPVIAAIRSDDDLEKVIGSSAQVVFVIHGSIMNIADTCAKLKVARKMVFIHLDMIEGLRGDAASLEFVKKYADPYGVITTKTSIVKHAKQLGLSTIQRIFIIDSMSLNTGIKNAKDVHPDAVEVMPGVASKIISKIQKEISVPIIAGGLISNKKDVVEALASGAVAVSTSDFALWNM